MERIDNGGKAFPALCNDHSCNEGGMSLRDWFAGQALPAVIHATCAGQHHPGDKHGMGTVTGMALDAYELADAMLAARKGRA